MTTPKLMTKSELQGIRDRWELLSLTPKCDCDVHALLAHVDAMRADHEAAGIAAAQTAIELQRDRNESCDQLEELTKALDDERSRYAIAREAAIDATAELVRSKQELNRLREEVKQPRCNDCGDDGIAERAGQLSAKVIMGFIKTISSEGR
jgi:septal ring factor EnvC (AmiA/AmiB activator)